MSSWSIVGAVLAVAIGAFLPLQALINAQLGRVTSGALFASFVSFLIGTIVLGLMVLALRVPMPGLAAVASLPAWAWLGGVIGAVYVASATVLVPRLGATALICLIVFGQIVASLLLDHHGVLVDARPADTWRIAGAILVLVGVVMVVQPWQGQ